MMTQDLEKTLEVPSKKLVTLQLDTEIRYCIDCGFSSDSCTCEWKRLWLLRQAELKKEVL